MSLDQLRAVLPRAALYGLTLALTLASWAIYGGLIARPPGSSSVVYFVLVPAVSCALVTIVVAIGALLARSTDPK
jgi:hypothetical protein